MWFYKNIPFAFQVSGTLPFRNSPKVTYKNTLIGFALGRLPESLKSFGYISLFSLCFFLTACGFHPMYTPSVNKSDISYPIKIATISDRNGQVLRNYLVDLLIPEGAQQGATYVLEIQLTETVAAIGVSKSETTTRKEATLTAAFILRDIRTNAVVYAHSAKAINSFSVISQNYYSDLVTDEYAKRQALRLLAEKITLLLTTYLDTQQ